MFNEILHDHVRGQNGLKRYLDQEDRSEKKKNREKYRRNEVNEKFNELADVMDVAEKILFTGQVMLEPGKTSSSKSDHICRAINMINSFVKENLFLKHQLEMQAQNISSPQITNISNNEYDKILDISKIPSIPIQAHIDPNSLESMGGYNIMNNFPQNTCCQQLYTEPTFNSDIGIPIYTMVNKSTPQPAPEATTHVITPNDCNGVENSKELHPIDCDCQKNKAQDELFDLSTWESDFFPFLSLSMWDEAEIPAPTHAEVA